MRMRLFASESRAPSIELGCADPNNPCSLPNALASDPPLSQVVTTTWEAGLRGKLEQYHLDWDLGLFEPRIATIFSLWRRRRQAQVTSRTSPRPAGRSAGQPGWPLQARQLRPRLHVSFRNVSSTETLDGNANSGSDIAMSGYPGVGASSRCIPAIAFR